MKNYICKFIVILIILLPCNNTFPQNSIDGFVPVLPDNTYQLKAGMEAYRSEFVGGIGYNFYSSKYVVLLSGIDFIGVPIISGSFKFLIPINRKVKLPH